MPPPSTLQASAKPAGWYKRNEIAITPWLFLAPGMLFFPVLRHLPDLPVLLDLALRLGRAGRAEFIGLGNYEEAAGVDRAFEVSLWNNLIWLVLYLLAIPAGLFIALFLNQTVWGIRLYKSLFFFPFVISQVVVGLVFTWFYDPTFGLLNRSFSASSAWSPINVLGDDAGDLRHHRRRALAADRLLHDPLPDRSQRGGSRADRGRAPGRRQGLADAVVRHPAAAAPATFIAFVVTIIGALRSFDLISIMTNGGPFGSTRVLAFLHVRKGAVRIRASAWATARRSRWCCS